MKKIRGKNYTIKFLSENIDVKKAYSSIKKFWKCPKSGVYEYKEDPTEASQSDTQESNSQAFDQNPFPSS